MSAFSAYNWETYDLHAWAAEAVGAEAEVL